MFDQIQTSQIGGQPYTDTSPLVNVLNMITIPIRLKQVQRRLERTKNKLKEAEVYPYYKGGPSPQNVPVWPAKRATTVGRRHE